MSGGDGVLLVDPAELAGVATEFDGAGHGLAALNAGAPLGDAADAVPQLATAAACRNAQATVDVDMAALADEARMFADSLRSAAAEYRERDASSAEAIDEVPVGG